MSDGELGIPEKVLHELQKTKHFFVFYQESRR